MFLLARRTCGGVGWTIVWRCLAEPAASEQINSPGRCRTENLSGGGRYGKETTGQIVETPTAARQAEPGPSVLALLTVSTGLAMMVLAGVWYVFFRT